MLYLKCLLASITAYMKLSIIQLCNQVKKLMFNRVSAGLEAMIKERRKKDACQSGIVFELMEHGRKTAIELKHTLGANPVEAGPLRQLASDTVDEDFGNVTMSMDFREGGGSAKSLHKMCDLLDDYRVPYVVRNLKIADYGEMLLSFIRQQMESCRQI